MAKKIKTKTKTKGEAVALGKTASRVIDKNLLALSRRLMYEYGTATLEERAIADFRDGFGPVHRRVLFAAHELGLRHNAKMMKSARVVGDTLGKYHPHGDLACYGAMINLTQNWSQAPLIQGSGNWGSLTDASAAAHRYTEARLSRFSDAVLFNKFYLPAMEFVPNYDSNGKEPLVLPSLLPMILINGHYGIATGAAAHIPTFEYNSVLNLLRKIYSGEELTPELMYKSLKFTSNFGGEERKPENKEERLGRMGVFKTCKGKVVLWSNVVYNEKTRQVVATKFAIGSMEQALVKISAFPGVKEVHDESNQKDRYGRLVVTLAKTLTTKAYSVLVKKIDKELSRIQSYNLNFTESYQNEEGLGAAKLIHMPLLEMMQLWLRWRVQLERRACAYWIQQDDKEIRKLDLMMIAVDNRKLIIESLDKDCTQEELEAWLARKLKITVEEAKFIYQMRVFQLRRLEKKSLLEQRKQVVAHKKELTERSAKPRVFLAKQLEEFADLIKA